MKILNEPTITATNTCPVCFEPDIEHHGTVRVPPIVVQMSDGHLNITRRWLSHRHHCPMCNEIFDVVITNEILEDNHDSS